MKIKPNALTVNLLRLREALPVKFLRLVLKGQYKAALQKAQDILRYRAAEKNYLPAGDVFPAIAEKTKKRLVMLVPYLIFGGAERVWQNVTHTLHENEWEIALIKTHFFHDLKQATDHWFDGAVAHIIDLQKILPENRDQALLKWIADFQPDAVWCVNSDTGYRLLPEIKRLLPKAALVDTLYNLDVMQAHNIEAIDLLDATTAENNAVGYFIRKRFKNTHRTEVIFSGIDLESFTPQQKPVQPPFVIGYCGRLSPEKNPQFMITLAGKFKDDPSIKILIGGDGALMSELKHRIAEENLSNVELAGNIKDVVGFMARCHAIVLPSYIDGRPQTLQEAMACGVPVVASAVGGVPEMLGDAGFVCKPDDLEGFTQPLLKMKNDPDFYRQRVAQTIAHTAENFDRRRMGQGYHDLFASLMKEKNHG